MLATFRNWLLFALLLAVLPYAHAAHNLTTTMSQDDFFRQLKDAARKEDPLRATQLAETLSNYPVPSYVDYYLLKSDLRNASDAEVEAYLSKYQGTAIADRLRNDWLLIQGRNQNWAVFDKHYPLFELNDDTQVKCYALMSKADKNVTVSQEARALLVNPRKYGEACYTLVSDLVEKQQWTDDDIWFQSRLALENNRTALAIRFASLSGASEASVSQAIESPVSILNQGAGENRISHEIYLLALGKLAKKDAALASHYLNEARPSLTPKEHAIGWSLIALPTSIALSQQALDYWKKASVPTSMLSPFAHEWKVRTALRHQNWRLVHEWINQMPALLQKDPAWIYWKGRSLLAMGQKEKAHALFSSIADQYHFYGLLAREELGKKIHIDKNPKSFSDKEIATMSHNSGFQLAQKFFEMNWRFEGIREWNWQLRKMNEHQLLVAAEYARKINLIDRMVSTSDRTQTEFDFTQRFPSPFKETVQSATESLGLDMAWTYGLIKQESRFVMNAHSSAGASGLMQLMPATAKFVAQKMGLSEYRPGKINSLETNVLLGTYYLNMLLNDLDESQTLATAGYNAGPRRPKNWRTSLSKPIDGAIFAETIPFSETRDYVKNVMFNATCCAALFEKNTPSLKQRLGIVTP